MINFTNITKAVKDILDAANSTNRRYIITRNEPVNEEDNKAVKGWVGIYRDRVEYDPQYTGTQPYLAEVVTRIEAQAASMASPIDCETRIEELIEFICTALTNNKNLNGYVAMIKGLSVD